MKEPGEPRCPYCGGDLFQTSRPHPVAIILAIHGILASIAMGALVSPAGYVGCLLSVLWILWIADRVWCHDCGLRVR
jgi:hypothetical protein